MSWILSAICTNYNATPPVTYATWNPADISADIALSNWNLTATMTALVAYRWVRATIWKSSWKWYWEIKWCDTWWGSVNWIWAITESLTHSNWVWWPLWWGVRLYQVYWDKQHNDWFSAFGWGTYADANTVVWYALDMDNGTLDIYQNWVLLWQAWNGIVGTVYPMLWVWNNYVNYIANFWATPFAYTPPVWFNAWLYE